MQLITLLGLQSLLGSGGLSCIQSSAARWENPACNGSSKEILLILLLQWSIDPNLVAACEMRDGARKLGKQEAEEAKEAEEAQEAKEEAKEEAKGGRANQKVLCGLLATNAATFSLWMLAPHLGKSSRAGRLLAGHFLCSRWHLRHGRFHTLVTSCMSHQRPLHFLLNSCALWTIGRVAAEELTVQEQLSLVSVCSVGSSLGHIVFHQRPVLGASGLLMGLLSSSSLIQPERRFHVLFVGTFSMAQLCDVALASNLIGFFLRAQLSSVAWAAHLGGSAAGFGFGIAARLFGDARFADPVSLRKGGDHWRF